MHSQHTYSPVIMRNIRSYIQDLNFEALNAYFQGLSNSEFRTAGKMMSDNVLPQLDAEVYWQCFEVLYRQSPKAWLVTLLKAAVALYARNKLTFEGEIWNNVCTTIADENRLIDERKLLQYVLPCLRTPAEVKNVLEVLLLSDEKGIKYLVEQNTVPCYYILFQKLRGMDNEPDKIALCCAEVLHKGGDKAFNFVSILKNYFDLPTIRGVFSLHINPYELSRLDSSYDLFVQMLTKI